MAVAATMSDNHQEGEAKEVAGSDENSSKEYGEIVKQQLAVKDPIAVAPTFAVAGSSTEGGPAIQKRETAPGVIPSKEKLDVEERRLCDALEQSKVATGNGTNEIVKRSSGLPSPSTTDTQQGSNFAVSDSGSSPTPYERWGTKAQATVTFEKQETVASFDLGDTKSRNPVRGPHFSVDEEETEATATDDAARTKYKETCFDLSAMMEADEIDSSDGGQVLERTANDGIGTQAKERRMAKMAKSSDKTTKIVASPKSAVNTPTAAAKKPLMDLRQILKKHEKKSETQEMNHSDHVDFFGSMSSIPFLKSNMPEKKKKGKRENKEKRSKKTGIEEPSYQDDGKEVKKTSIVTEDRAGKKRTTEVTLTMDYDADDLSMWKSLSALNGNSMEEFSDRPRDMLPLVPVPSPKKEDEKPPPQHNHRGFHRPDDWVEFGHPKKRSPVKSTYRPKEVGDAPVIDAPSVFNGLEVGSAAEEKQEQKVTQGESSPRENLAGKRYAESVSPRKSKGFPTPVQSPLAKATSNSPNATGPSRYQPQPKVEKSQQSGLVSPNDKKPPAKSEKQKVYQVTELAIQFHDGCVVNGHFRSNESVKRVIQDLRRDILRNDIPLPSFDLCFQSPDGDRKKLDPTMTLDDLNLLPSAKVYVSWTEPMANTMASGWYLLDEDGVPAGD